jgi:hypothetical protein
VSEIVDSGDEDELLRKIHEWLETPQTHLDEKTRRKILELVVSEHVDRVRRQERVRTRGRDFLLLGAVLTATASALPYIGAFFGGDAP